MESREFANRVGVSIKTAYWLYTNKLNKAVRISGQTRCFTEKDVHLILSMKLENFKGNIRQVEGYKNYYITDEGKVYTNRRNILEEIKGYITNDYRYVALWENGKTKYMKVSKLVALHYVPNPLKKPVPNHKDGNKQNDHYTNLEWVTIAENTQHAYDMGLARNDKGAEDSQSIAVDLYSNDGVFIAHFGSISEASRETGKLKSTIARQAKHERLGRDGFSFRYSK